MMAGKRDCFHPIARHTHGTYLAYLKDGCRCFPCRLANSDALASYRAGEPWREIAWMPSIGARRRLQALAAIGHSARAVGKITGLSEQYVQNLRSDRNHPQMRPETWRKIAKAYDDLWDKPNLTNDGRRNVTRARDMGYLPPLAWDDESLDDPDGKPDPAIAAMARPKVCPECRKRLSTFSAWRSHRTNLHGFIYQPAESADGPAELDEIAVDLIMHGHLRVPANTHSPERLEAIRRLAARGMNDYQIGQRLHMKRDAVAQNRERHGIPAGRARESAA